MASFCIVPSGDSPHDRFLAMLPKIREKIAFEFRTISGEEFEEINRLLATSSYLLAETVRVRSEREKAVPRLWTSSASGGCSSLGMTARNGRT